MNYSDDSKFVENKGFCSSCRNWGNGVCGRTGERVDWDEPACVVCQSLEIEHINMIEDPDLAGKPVIVEGVVSSTSIAYLVPKEVEAHVVGDDGKDTVQSKTFDIEDPINLKLVGVNEDVKYRRLKRVFGGESVTRVEEKSLRTVYMVRVRPPVFTLEKRGGRIIDERGFEYKAFDVYVVSDRALTFRPSSLVKIRGKPLGSPKTQKTVLLASRVEFPEDASNFDEEKLRILKDKLGSMASVKQRIEWILKEFEKFSSIVGRRNLAYAGLLAFFTPVWIKIGNEVQRGWAVILSIGDTTTGKSETVLKLIRLLKGGMFVTAETASQVGLTGTMMQLEKEGWFVDWGFLVLCDGKLIAMDGVHKLPFSCWASLAEAERQGIVTIAKAAKNSAYARTRQIKIANPVDQEAERFKTKALGGFVYACQALPTILDATSIARLDLAVFSNLKDVKAEDVNVKPESSYDPDLELLAEVLKWCWSGKVRIEFTEGAINKILSYATELHRMFFSPSVPLVSIDMKWKLARLSAALAFLTLSTDDFETLRVTEEHVEEVVAFIQEEYGKAGLSTLAQEERYEVMNSQDAEAAIENIVKETKLERCVVEDIIKFIALSGRVTRDQLWTKFGLKENKQLRPLMSSLLNDRMISMRRGIYPTARLIELYKLLSSSRLTGLSRSTKDPQNGGQEAGASGYFRDSSGGLINHPSLIDNLSLEGRDCVENLSTVDVIEKLRKEFSKGTTDDFITVVIRLGGSEEFARAILNKLVREGKLVLNIDNSWRWA